VGQILLVTYTAETVDAIKNWPGGPRGLNTGLTLCTVENFINENKSTKLHTQKNILHCQSELQSLLKSGVKLTE